MDKYQYEPRVIIAHINCTEQKSTYLNLVVDQAYPSIVLFKKSRGSRINPPASIFALSEVVEDLKNENLTVPCLRYPLEFDGAFPYFVFRSTTISTSEVCDTLLRITDFLPEASTHLYYESPAQTSDYVAHLRENVTAKYGGVLEFPSMVKFTKNYLMTPLGYWRLDDGPISSRRFAFIVHDGLPTIVALKRVAERRVSDFLVGSIRTEEFAQEEPDVQLVLPAVFAMSAKKTGFMVANNVTSGVEFEKLLDKVLRGDLEGLMNLRLPRLFERWTRYADQANAQVAEKRRVKWLWFAVLPVAALAAGVAWRCRRGTSKFE
jgi:hypothetical protein